MFKLTFALIISIVVLTGVTFLQCSAPDSTNSSLADLDSTTKVYGPYELIKLPITRGSVQIGNPIQIAIGPGGRIYAANQSGEVYTLNDSDGDGLEDSTALFCNVGDFGLRSPAGFATRNDTIYIGAAEQIRAFVDLDKDGTADTSWIFFGMIPESQHPYEWSSGLSFGADGWLYVALTTDSFNASPAGDAEGIRGAIIRISPDGRKFERLATGIRSVPGMCFNDQGDLFFTDNAGGGNPTEELNLLSKGKFYGHNKNKYPKDSALIEEPVFSLESEIAPSSIEFNKASNDFGGTAGDLFVSYYGPGERWDRGAIGRVVMRKNNDGSYQFEEYTIADVPKISDLAFGNDGSLFLAHHGKADYWYNAINKNEGGFYKLQYNANIPKAADYKRPKQVRSFASNSIEKGKQLFAETGCLGCHQVDGITELLGPNLKDIARNYSREEILEEIAEPSKRIKPSMGAVRITRTDGLVLLGRVINSDEEQLSFMLVGNRVLTIPRKEISKVENERKSLMYENLVKNMPEDQVNALLDYLVSLSQ